MHSELQVEDTPRSAGELQDSKVLVVVVCLAAILGAFVRLEPVLSAAFPVLDGGLFYSMIQDLLAAGFRLPEFSSYNQLSIPFLYPPLSFYVAGLLSVIAGVSLEDLVRLLPALLSLLTIPAFYILARSILRSRVAVTAAFCAFCLLPTAFDFLIVGGGLPRGFGYLFSMLTLSRAVGVHGHGGSRHALVTALLAGLTVLSHPVIAWFTLYSFAILVFFTERNRRGLRHFLVVWAGAMVFAAPWWVTGVVRHGLSPFLMAFQAGSSSWEALLAPLLFLHTNEPYMSLLGVVALLGLFSSLRSRKYALPAWLGAVFLLEPRLSATYGAIPTALLAGFGLEAVVLPGLVEVGGTGGVSDQQSAEDRHGGDHASRAQRPRTGRGWVAGLATGYMLLYLLVAAFLAAPRAALTPAERDALEWVRISTPATSRFAVVSGIATAGTDYVSEWFPSLTGRVSVATAQGREWLPGRAYARSKEVHADLQACAGRGEECLAGWAETAGMRYTHVLIVKSSAGESRSGEGGALYISLLRSSAYSLVYDTPEAAVFSHNVAQSP
jgi:hypothetical protein